MDVIDNAAAIFVVQFVSLHILAVCASFAHELVQAICLDLVQFILSDAIAVWTFSFSAYYK